MGNQLLIAARFVEFSLNKTRAIIVIDIVTAFSLMFTFDLAFDSGEALKFSQLTVKFDKNAIDTEM